MLPGLYFQTDEVEVVQVLEPVEGLVVQDC